VKWRKIGQCAAALWLAVELSGDALVELPAYRVEAWHFDNLGTEVAADVVRAGALEVAATGAGSVPEVLERLAGVRFHGYTAGGGEGQLALRGFGDNSGLRVLVLVDGVAYNPPDMGGINWLGMDPVELETVEVIRGGQSVLYGNQAVAGVVKLRTRMPEGPLAGTLRIAAGSWGEARASGAVEGRTGEFGLRLGGHGMEADGYREHSAWRARTGYLAWMWEGAAAGEWRGRAQVDSTETRFPGPLTYQQMRTDPRQSTASGSDGALTRTRMLALSGSGEGAIVEWDLQAGFLERDREWQLDGREADNRHRRWTASPRARAIIPGGFVMAGVDIAQDRLDTTDYLSRGEGIVRAEADIERLTLGGYLFGSLLLGGGWTLSGGLRLEGSRTDNLYRHYREEQLRPELETNRGTVPNPEYRDPPETDPRMSFDGRIDKSGWAAELSLMRDMGNGLHLWTGWDRVYRYPSLDETASYQGYPLADPLNTGLAPETGHNFELGLKRVGDNWHLGTTVFLMRLDDEIAFDDEALLNANIGATERIGVEVSAGYQTSGYGFAGRLGRTRAVYRSGGPAAPGATLPLVPEHEGTLSGWLALWRNLRLRGHVQVISGRVQGNDYSAQRQRIPGYTLAGAAVSWEGGGGLSASLAVDNLFDGNHAVTAYNGGFYPGAGRRFTFRAGARF
jgi:iron complex outermembrane recepter protein